MILVAHNIPLIRKVQPKARDGIQDHLGGFQGARGGPRAGRSGDWSGTQLSCGQGQLYVIPCRLEAKPSDDVIDIPWFRGTFVA